MCNLSTKSKQRKQPYSPLNSTQFSTFLQHLYSRPLTHEHLLKYQTLFHCKIIIFLLPLCPNRISKTPTLQGYLANNTKNIRAQTILCFYDLHFYIFPLLIRFEPDFRDSKFDFCICVYHIFG